MGKREHNFVEENLNPEVHYEGRMKIYELAMEKSKARINRDGE